MAGALQPPRSSFRLLPGRPAAPTSPCPPAAGSLAATGCGLQAEVAHLPAHGPNRLASQRGAVDFHRLGLGRCRSRRVAAVLSAGYAGEQERENGCPAAAAASRMRRPRRLRLSHRHGTVGASSACWPTGATGTAGATPGEPLSAAIIRSRSSPARRATCPASLGRPAGSLTVSWPIRAPTSAGTPAGHAGAGSSRPATAASTGTPSGGSPPDGHWQARTPSAYRSPAAVPPVLLTRSDAR